MKEKIYTRRKRLPKFLPMNLIMHKTNNDYSFNFERNGAETDTQKEEEEEEDKKNNTDT